MGEEKNALVYDACSVPDGIDLDTIVRIWKEHNFIVYDSHNGETPSIHNPNDIEAVVVDISNTDEETLKQIQKLIKS